MTFHFVIPSNFIEAREPQKRIIDAVKSCGFNGDDIFGIKLALEEALINAIKHGNKFDKKKKVKLDASITPKRVAIDIEDEGPGFNRCRVPDPTADENLTKSSGRGILLMEAYMDSITFSKNGRRVHLLKTKGKDHDEPRP